MKRVSETVAKSILEELIERPEFCNDRLGHDIKNILEGSHKTYKYVLVTALLAKATNVEIDILSLQAKDETEGAYDARSLCHNVVVPFERDYLPNSLGGSNEPYLNKPARYPRLTTDNAVRRGKDMETLKLLISVLNRVTSSLTAKKYLSSAISNLVDIYSSIEEKYALPDLDPDMGSSPQIILDYINELIKNSYEGEVCPLVVAAIEHLYYDGERKVLPHKVNESGASSKEVGDIDIFDNEGNIVTSIEVKDKDFAKIDVEHAIKKFAYARLKKTLFIYGDAVMFDEEEVNESAKEYGRNGYYCTIMSIMNFAKLRLYSIQKEITLQTFAQLMLDYAVVINAKDETVKWIKDLAIEFSL